jgi:hypothetical protein
VHFFFFFFFFFLSFFLIFMPSLRKRINRGTYKEVSGGGDHLDYGKINILYCIGVSNAENLSDLPPHHDVTS